MVDKTENIYVDFDSNNIIVVNPNKVVDEKGNVKDRFVKQEDLVMYANLSCQVFPRTKLALGVAANDSIQTISIASINFLSPGGDTFLNNKYVDEITGKDSLQGRGINQPNKTTVTNKKVPDDVYIRQNIRSNGEDKATDTGLLGITRINIRQGTDFMPTFDITLEDVKGRALFEAGNSSPYAAFFNMPYPMFELTLKGYYGKGIRYKLMLRSFNARYDYSSGNFIVELKFHTYQFSCLAEISMGYLLAVPYMYQSRYSVTPKIGTPSNIKEVTNVDAYKGYEKIKEMYTEYKTKGLIPQDFPNLTIGKLRYNIENFIKNILDTFSKQNLTPLDDITSYEKTLQQLRSEVYQFQTTSWIDSYMDTKNFLVLKETGFGSMRSLIPASTEGALTKYNILKSTKSDDTIIYTFKSEFNNLNKRNEAKEKLKYIVDTAVDKLNSNVTLGQTGSYKVDGRTTSSSISVDLNYEMFEKTFVPDDVDFKKTFVVMKNRNPTTQEELELKRSLEEKGVLKNQINTVYTLKNGQREAVNEYFFYEGQGSFTEKLNEIDNQVKKYKKQIEDELTDALFKLMKSNENGIGFKPTIRNVLAVIFANGEAFLRLLEEVHRKAWDVREDRDRKRAIFDASVASASPDNIASGVNENVPVYPWPTFLISTTGENGHEKFEPRYPGDKDVIKITKSYNSEKWPEVEFVEEFTKGYTVRAKENNVPQPVFNEVLDVKRISLNAIEFPISNTVFQNKEEVKYFFEIFERILFLSNNSRLNRIAGTPGVIDIMANAIAEAESINIKESLSSDNPFLIKKLGQYGYSANNFLLTLRHMSNQGVGVSWQNYIRGIYNTPYIKSINETSEFLFLDEIVMQNPLVRPTVSLKSEEPFIDILTGNTATNQFDFLDVYPFVDFLWVKNKLADGKKLQDVIDVNSTTKTISYDKKSKVLTNYALQSSIVPITNFGFKDAKLPSPENYVGPISSFYKERTPNKQMLTEGNLEYTNYSGFVSPNQTISMMNTPYFVNAIQEGVKKFREFDEHPFVSAAYLFINSLPLSTLREKYKSYDLGLEKELDYICMAFKKYGAIHKLPYPFIVKIGSIWHRYKKYVNEDIDILDNVWKDFDYVTNFDPVTSASTKNYTFNVNGGTVDIILQKNTTYGTDTSTLINTGFYPKLINDFNVFYQGYEIISSTIIITGKASIANNIMTVTSASTNNLQVGDFILATNVLAGTSIVNQLTGVPGGLGTYTVTNTQTVNTVNFKVETNLPGYTNTNIQNAINNLGLNLKFVRETLISGEKGFDEKNLQRDIRVIPWSVFVTTSDEKFVYPFPSMGSLINQAQSECFQGTQMKFELSGNTSMFNGTVRNFWGLPTYGYFDNSRVLQNSPKKYLKEILLAKPENPNEVVIQPNFNIKGDSTKYADISEMFSIFEKDILDLFEEKFLNFSKSMYDINTEVDYGMNFQKLMVDMMKIPVQTGTTANQVISKMQEQQLSGINEYIGKFIETSMYVKYGNPGNFDRKLFLSFSNYEITDPYVWTKYRVDTPDSLPTEGGTVTLSYSKTEYPNEWKALETYIGYSEIEKLTYSDNGSYITDFFVDLNVAFTVENIKTFSPIIKIYASQKLIDYNDSAIIPANEPNENSYAVLSDGNIIELIPTNKFKVTPVLYDPDKVVLFTGGAKILFGGNPEIKIFNQTITDYYGEFGIQDNPITTTYIRPSGLKLDVPFESDFNFINFKTLVDEYIDNMSKFQDKALNNLFVRLQSPVGGLPSVVDTPEQMNGVVIDTTIGKLEYWECFKAINDKWIAGYEYNNKTLFEDVLLLDRASRNIGDDIIVDVYALKSRLDSLYTSDPKISMMGFVESILVENNFVVMNLPSYVNFYNVQEASKKPTPVLEKSSDFANTMFGTFLNVDIRNSSAKMVCQYASKPSEVLDVKNVDFKFRDDAFDINKPNPLLEDQKNKEDWDKSNRVVGFNVDIGTENQSIFYNFSVGQESGTATAESLEIENMMANMSSGKNSATQTISLYNIYKNRSYTCTVSMVGNALIQPTMYFNLRYVPMFHGPYMITQVNHTIGPGNFETIVEGIRQPAASILKIDGIIQTLRTKLLKSVIEKQQQDRAKTTLATNSSNPKEKTDIQNQIDSQRGLTPNNNLDESGNCGGSLFTDYKKYTLVENPTQKEFAPKEVRTKIISRMANMNLSDDGKLKYVVFASIYMSSFQGVSFKAYEGNYTNHKLTTKWSTTPTTKYFCKIVGGTGEAQATTPFMVFNSIDGNIDYLLNRYKSRMVTIKSTRQNPVEFVNDITKFLILNSENDVPETTYSKMDATVLSNLKSKVESSNDLFDSLKG